MNQRRNKLLTIPVNEAPSTVLTLSLVNKIVAFLSISQKKDLYTKIDESWYKVLKCFMSPQKTAAFFPKSYGIKQPSFNHY